VFGKVKALIGDMIQRLLEEADAEATHKAYCDKEMSETQMKSDDKTSEVARLSVKIDQVSSSMLELSEEVALLQKELVELARANVAMDKMRQTEKVLFFQTKKDLEDGVRGVQFAMKVLRDYFARSENADGYESSSGAGTSIIGLLEVVESDFSKDLSEINAEEEAAQSAYEGEVQANKIQKVSKEQDKFYKTKELKALEKSVGALKSDQDNVQAALGAVGEYMSKLLEQCIAKPEPYEKRKAHRQAEIAGLQQALELLSNGGAEVSSLLHEGSNRRPSLRGVKAHYAS